MTKNWSGPHTRSGRDVALSTRHLRMETLELRVALGGRSADAAQRELDELQAQEQEETENANQQDS